MNVYIQKVDCTVNAKLANAKCFALLTKVLNQVVTWWPTLCLLCYEGYGYASRDLLAGILGKREGA